MRHLIITISLLFVTSTLLSQRTKKRGHISSWHDRTFIPVVLKDTIVDDKIVAVEIGSKAIIYIKLKPLIFEANENLSNDFSKDAYKNIIHFFDSASLESDTIFIEDYYDLDHFEYLVAHQLTDGNAKVYYKKKKVFVDTITHRLERYGGNADRFFYLPDKRPFFAVTEYIGIIDKVGDFSNKGHLEAYIKEGEKLASVQEE